MQGSLHGMLEGQMNDSFIDEQSHQTPHFIGKLPISQEIVDQ